MTNQVLLERLNEGSDTLSQMYDTVVDPFGNNAISANTLSALNSSGRGIRLRNHSTYVENSFDTSLSGGASAKIRVSFFIKIVSGTFSDHQRVFNIFSSSPSNDGTCFVDVRNGVYPGDYEARAGYIKNGNPVYTDYYPVHRHSAMGLRDMTMDEAMLELLVDNERGQLKFYINGSLAEQINNSGKPVDAGYNKIQLGCIGTGLSSSGVLFFDELRVRQINYYYIGSGPNMGGNNSYDGLTQATSWQSWDASTVGTHVQPGDEVHYINEVNGTHVDSLALQPNIPTNAMAYGSSGMYVTVSSQALHQNSSQLARTSNTQFIRVQGGWFRLAALTIRDSSSVGASANQPLITVESNANHVVIDKVDIAYISGQRNLARSFVSVFQQGVSDLVIHNCTIGSRTDHSRAVNSMALINIAQYGSAFTERTRIENCNIGACDFSAIKFAGATNISIVNNVIKNTGSDAIFLGDSSNINGNVIIQGNSISQVGGVEPSSSFSSSSSALATYGLGTANLDLSYNVIYQVADSAINLQSQQIGAIRMFHNTIARWGVNYVNPNQNEVASAISVAGPHTGLDVLIRDNLLIATTHPDTDGFNYAPAFVQVADTSNISTMSHNHFWGTNADHIELSNYERWDFNQAIYLSYSNAKSAFPLFFASSQEGDPEVFWIKTNDYRPTVESPLINKASDGTVIGALQIPYGTSSAKAVSVVRQPSVSILSPTLELSPGQVSIVAFSLRGSVLNGSTQVVSPSAIAVAHVSSPTVKAGADITFEPEIKSFLICNTGIGSVLIQGTSGGDNNGPGTITPDGCVAGHCWELPTTAKRSSSHSGLAWIPYQETGRPVLERAEMLNSDVFGIDGPSYTQPRFAVLIHISWSTVNPSENAWDWSSIDSKVNDIASRGAGIGYSFWPVIDGEAIPGWVSSKYGTNFSIIENQWNVKVGANYAILIELEKFMIQIANRYGSDAKLAYIDMRTTFDEANGEWTTVGGTPSSASVVRAYADTMHNLWHQTWVNRSLDVKKLVSVVSNPDFEGLQAANNVYAKGMGQRDGLPSKTHLWEVYGNCNRDSDGYISIDESHIPIVNKPVYYSQLTEFLYHDDTWGPRAATYDRFVTAAIWAMQIRRNWVALPRLLLHNEDEYPYNSLGASLLFDALQNKEMIRWIQLQQGHDAETANDAWALLNEVVYTSHNLCANQPSETTVKNAERWLYQRDVPVDGITTRQFPANANDLHQIRKDGIKIDSANNLAYDYACRSFSNKMYFRVDPNFMTGGDVQIKVTYWDEIGSDFDLRVTGGDLQVVTSPIVAGVGTVNPNGKQWKTCTFAVNNISFSHLFTGGNDFILRKRGSVDPKIRFVRVLKVAGGIGTGGDTFVSGATANASVSASPGSVSMPFQTLIEPTPISMLASSVGPIINADFIYQPIYGSIYGNTFLESIGVSETAKPQPATVWASVPPPSVITTTNWVYAVPTTFGPSLAIDEALTGLADLVALSISPDVITHTRVAVALTESAFTGVQISLIIGNAAPAVAFANIVPPQFIASTVYATVIASTADPVIAIDSKSIPSPSVAIADTFNPEITLTVNIADMVALTIAPAISIDDSVITPVPIAIVVATNRAGIDSQNRPVIVISGELTLTGGSAAEARVDTTNPLELEAVVDLVAVAINPTVFIDGYSVQPDPAIAIPDAPAGLLNIDPVFTFAAEAVATCGDNLVVLGTGSQSIRSEGAGFMLRLIKGNKRSPSLTLNMAEATYSGNIFLAEGGFTPGSGKDKVLWQEESYYRDGRKRLNSSRQNTALEIVYDLCGGTTTELAAIQREVSRFFDAARKSQEESINEPIYLQYRWPDGLSDVPSPVFGQWDTYYQVMQADISEWSEAVAKGDIVTGNIPEVSMKLVCSPYPEGAEQLCGVVTRSPLLTDKGVYVADDVRYIEINGDFTSDTDNWNEGWLVSANAQLSKETYRYLSYNQAARFSALASGAFMYYPVAITMTSGTALINMSFRARLDDGSVIDNTNLKVYFATNAGSTLTVNNERYRPIGDGWYLVSASMSAATGSTYRFGILSVNPNSYVIDNVQVNPINLYDNSSLGAKLITDPSEYIANAPGLVRPTSLDTHKRIEVPLADPTARWKFTTEMSGLYTVAGWVVPAHNAGSGGLQVFSYQTGNGGAGESLLRVLGGGAWIIAKQAATTDFYQSGAATNVTEYGVPIHIALVQSRTKLTLYQNGEEVLSANVYQPLKPNGVFGLGGGQSTHYSGHYDAWRIWNIPFYKEQIEQLYKNERLAKLNNKTISPIPLMWARYDQANSIGSNHHLQNAQSDDGNSTNKYNGVVVTGVPGDVPAITRYELDVYPYTINEFPTSVRLGVKVVPMDHKLLVRNQVGQDKAFFYNFGGTNVSPLVTSNGDYQSVVVSSLAADILSQTDNRHLMPGRYSVHAHIQASGSLTIRPAYRYGTTTYAGTDFNYTPKGGGFELKEIGDLFIPDTGYASLSIGLQAVSSGSVAFSVGFVALMPYPYVHAKLNVATDVYNDVQVYETYHIDGGDAAYIRNPTKSKRVDATVIGTQQPFVEPYSYNYIYMLNGNSTDYSTADEADIRVYVTPRYQLPGGPY